MSSLAEIALDHARQRLAGKRPVAPTSAVPKINMPASKPISTGFVAPDPLDRHLFLEGRAWALELAKSLRGCPVAVVVERLAGATLGRPPSYVAGIQAVIKALQEGVVDHHPTGKPVLGTELEARPCA